MLEKLTQTDRKKLIWGINIGLVLFYVLYFFVILQSCYSADDLFNANAAATNYMEGDSVWKLTVRQWKLWLSSGRFYPFSNYTYLLFAALPNRFVYKSLILISVYVNSLLMSKCIRKITGSETVGYLLMLIFPFALQLSSCDDNAYYCFQMLPQVVMFMCELSMLATFAYIDKKEEKRSAGIFAILAALTLMIALGTYEVAFIMAAFIGLGTWCYTGSVKKSLKILIPDIVVYIFMLIMNVLVRIFANSDAAYDGTSVNLSLKAIAVTFLKQVYATFPLARFIRDVVTGERGSMREMLASLSIRDIVMVALFVVLLAVFIRLIERERFRSTSNVFVFFTGLSLLVFPALLISFMQKYQEELYWGFGQISSYIQNFGLALILLSIYMLIIMRTSDRGRNIALTVTIIIAIPLMLLQQMNARVDVAYKYSIYGYCRDTALAAAKDGVLDDVGTGDYLFGTSDYIFDLMETKSFYTFAAKREIEGIESTATAATLANNLGAGSRYDLTNVNDNYFAAYTYADASGGYTLVGKVDSVTLSGSDTVDDMILSNINVYITGDTTFDTSGWTLVNQTTTAAMYSYTGSMRLSDMK